MVTTGADEVANEKATNILTAKKPSKSKKKKTVELKELVKKPQCWICHIKADPLIVCLCGIHLCPECDREIIRQIHNGNWQNRMFQQWEQELKR